MTYTYDIKSMTENVKNVGTAIRACEDPEDHGPRVWVGVNQILSDLNVHCIHGEVDPTVHSELVEKLCEYDTRICRLNKEDLHGSVWDDLNDAIDFLSRIVGLNATNI